MSDHERRVILLGPQAHHPTLRQVAEEAVPTGRIATIRAGWQEAETDDGAISEALGGRDVNLRLHERADRIFYEDPELKEAHHRMQQGARLLRRTYNIRLSHLMDAEAELRHMPGPDPILDPEREAALQSIRDLDRWQEDRVGALRAEFASSMHLGERDGVARERADLAAVLRGASAVVVDGGHVAVLLNRIRLFGADLLLGDRTVIGISGGAMVLSDRLILFHDMPPWGPGHPEVAERGLSVAQGIVPLPHANYRLRLDDPERVTRLARRLAPARCVLLDDGARADRTGDGWSATSARGLTESGQVDSLGSAA